MTKGATMADPRLATLTQRLQWLELFAQPGPKIRKDGKPQDYPGPTPELLAERDAVRREIRALQLDAMIATLEAMWGPLGVATGPVAEQLRALHRERDALRAAVGG